MSKEIQILIVGTQIIRVKTYVVMASILHIF